MTSTPQPQQTIIVTGGRRGLQIELKPADLVKALGATGAELSA